MAVNEDAALLAAIEAHVALQRQRVSAAAGKRNPLQGAFPLDPNVFEEFYPDTKAPAPARDLIARISEGIPISSWMVGFGSYRGQFLPGVDHVVISMDTNGDHGYLCILDHAGQLVACACRNVEYFVWVSLEEMIPYARTSTCHPKL